MEQLKNQLKEVSVNTEKNKQAGYLEKQLKEIETKVRYFI